MIAADLDSQELEEYETFLTERAKTGAGPHREQFERALSVLRSATDDETT